MKMVSLANGSTDILSNPIPDLTDTEIIELGSPKEQDNAVPEPELKEKVWSFRFLTKKRVMDPGSSEVTNESLTEAESPNIQKSLVETIVAALDKSENAPETTDNDLCNGSSDDPSLPSGGCESLINGKRSPDLVDTNTSLSTVSPAGLGNFVLVGNLKNIGKGSNKRKLYLVNSSSLLKGTSTTEMLTNDEGSASVTQNINDVIKKMKAVSPNTDVTALKSTSSTRSFVQLSQSNMKNIKLKVTSTSKNSVLLKPNQSYEILRTKLLENRVDNPEPTLTEIPTEPVEGRTVFKTVIGTPQVYFPKFANESSAVTAARNELIRCRKKLIDAAISPKLTMKVPLLTSSRPIFFCEECRDSFTSEDSLKNHKDRRSVLFTYACPSCKQNLEFYNRCMFLLHIRSHDSAVKACYLTISTIPSSKLKFHTLEECEESSTSVEDPSERSSSGPSIHIPVIHKPLIESADRSTESSSVRIVKSMKKKKHPPAAAAVDNANKRLSNDDSSSLRSLLIGEREFSQAKSREENSKLHDELPLPKSSISKRKRSSDSSANDPESSIVKTENVTKSKPASKTSVSNASEEQEASDSSDVVVCGMKRKEFKTPAAGSGVVEEIVLTSSDEEEDSLPDSNQKSALVMCRDCKKEVPNLTQHYREDNRPRKEYPCEQCKFFNTSACALSAHNRMHTKTPPFVCPDCGYFFSTLGTFLLHVKQVCFYDFKSIRFKCPECSVLKPSVPKFTEHLRRDHTREVFKCDACMTPADSSATVEAHIAKMHPNSEKSVSVLEGYWCKLCPNMLVSKPLINHHIKKHVYSLQYLRYVYICKMCKNYASLRRSKFAHHHDVCPMRKQTEMDLPQLVTKKPNRIRKRLAKKNGKSKNNEVKEVRKESSLGENCVTNNLKKDVKNLCIMCCQTRVSESSSLFCQQCVQLVDADDTSSPSEMTSSEGARFKRKFKCKVCKECMDRDWSTITKHFETYHQSDFDVRAKMRNSSSDSNAQAIAINRKRKLLVKPQENSKVWKGDPKYRCVKCNIATNDRKSFHEHIVTHKSQSDFQCLECGLCFIVRLSLEKHLLVEHKIRYGDLKAYFKENGIELLEEKVEERTLKENQCEVCYLHCGSKQNYDKHIRTHGMAFVAMQSKAKT